jgi:hypothetical protein
MTRIESGAIKLHRKPCDMKDLIGASIEQLGRRVDKNPIKVDGLQTSRSCRFNTPAERGVFCSPNIHTILRSLTAEYHT